MSSVELAIPHMSVENLDCLLEVVPSVVVVVQVVWEESSVVELLVQY